MASTIFPSPGDPTAIRDALRACAESGGGTVEVAPGVWHSLPLELASNVRLDLKPGAIIEFLPDVSRYFPEVFVRWEGIECFSAHPLIYAKDAHDVAITGHGILRGNGETWHVYGAKQEHRQRAEKLRRLASLPPAQRFFRQTDDFLRPSFVHFVNCRNVLWENFTIDTGPMWTLHPVYCENLVARGLVVRTTGPNTDGLNPDSCDGVLIENCIFSTGDDCIAIKSGLNADGWRVGKPCRNIKIKNCEMTSGHAGVAIGSELSGGIENVDISHCNIRNTGLGIRIKSLPGRGGFVRDVRVSDVEMRDLKSTAIHLDMAYPQTTLATQELKGTALENISFDRVVCYRAPIGIYLRGAAGMPVKDLRFADVETEVDQSIVCEGEKIAFSR